MSDGRTMRDQRMATRWHAFRVLRILLKVCLCAISTAGFSAGSAEYQVQPPPAWVVPVERGAPSDALRSQVSGGVYYLLSDAQERAAPDRVRYHRIASQAVTAEGVQAIANISILFEPSYQTLVLHSIDVIRDGRVIPKLGSATVRMLQRETELERRIYDGSKTATIFLDDVRVGDIVDYAYSVRGWNPVFDGKVFGRLGLQFNVPVARIHARIAVPTGSPVAIVSHGTSLKPVVEDTAGVHSQTWERTDVPAQVVEADEPGWYDPLPAVQWSAYRDWNDVARWAVPLYAVPASTSAALQAEVDRIAKAESTAEGRLLSALRFVQGEIRYLGIAMGVGSHAPTAPDLVLERRFGDCKDKTLLLLTLLDRLGVDARAALVSTDLRRGLESRQPGPGQFNHVLVQARIGDAHYWLDPTRSAQNADMKNLAQADFDLALVVEPHAQGFTSMKAESATPVRQVQLTYDARAGLDKPVAFTVVTSATGERADALRSSLASSNAEALQKSYLNFYASTYPGITVAAPMAVQDDERANRITVTENYSIVDFAVWSDTERRFTASVSTPDMLQVLRVPAAAARTAPLGTAHPVDLTVTTEVHLPEEWPIKAETVTVEDPAFLYERSVEPGSQRFSITERYRSRRDEVPAAEAVRYASNIARARESTFYQLHWADPDRVTADGLLDRVNWLLAAIAAMTLGFLVWLAIRAWHVDPPAPGPASASAPSGFGGWLLLPTLGVLFSPFAMMHALYTSSSAWSARSWVALTTYGADAYHPLWAPALLFELVAMLGLLVFWALTLVLFFQRRTSAPIWYIRMIIATTVYSALDLAFMALLPITVEQAQVARVVRNAFSTGIWIAYFLKSERVRATFVNRRQPAPTAAGLHLVAETA